ncbi:MAG: Uma2 family endonuclease [Deltaproteobacteria bacterium]|nr:Uma2 family endonuclease [Deltaproteobacteria bacterium]
MVTQPSPVLFTYAEYSLIPPDGKRWELIEGDFEVNPAPVTMHQVHALRLARTLLTQLEDMRLGEVFVAPFDVILGPHNVVEPDLVVISAAHKDRVSDRGLEGIPDIIVEILSQNRAYDEVLKRALYEKHGIPEYWIVDGAAATVTQFVLQEGRYTVHAVRGREDTLTSPQFNGRVQVALSYVFAPR